MSWRDALLLESLGQAIRGAAFAIPGALGVQEGGYLLLAPLRRACAPDAALALSFAKRAREILLGVPGLFYLHHCERAGAARKASSPARTPCARFFVISVNIATTGDFMRAIILAAGRGSASAADRQTDKCPKCLLTFRRHEPARAASAPARGCRRARRSSSRSASATSSSRRSSTRLGRRSRPEIVLNPRYELGSMLTVHSAAEPLTRGGDVLLMDADVLYHERIMAALTAGARPVEPGADRPRFRGRRGAREGVCARGRARSSCARSSSPDLEYDTIGESVGFFRFDERAARRLAAIVADHVRELARAPAARGGSTGSAARAQPGVRGRGCDRRALDRDRLPGGRGTRGATKCCRSSRRSDGHECSSAGPRRARFEAPRSRSAALRRMLLSDRLEFLMEAHNGLSARIVREAGFNGIWASGLSISAQFGVRDNNEASWTQVVDMLEFMADASNLPILLDGDTGYGNFNNVRRLVRKLEQRGIAGVCIEDKQFPKTNSFLNGDRQPLADIDEFCGKIAAGKNTQLDPDFSIVARVEALIAGWGMEEALRRAEAYRRAGADAILIHSKLSKPDEILTFAREWARPRAARDRPDALLQHADRCVPQGGHQRRHLGEPRAALRRRGHAEHGREIFESETLVNVEDRIASVEEIFRLQDADEYSAAERLYLSAARSSRGAVVLAASRGKGLEAVTEDRPKVMLPIAGKPLLRWLVDAFKKQSINDITVVGGYRADAIDTAGVRLVVNERYAQTGELASLACAIDALESDTVISYGDLLFRSYVLRDLVESEADLAVVVDSSPTGENNRTVRDFAYCSRRDDRGLFGTPVLLKRVLSAADAGRRPARTTVSAFRSRARPLDRHVEGEPRGPGAAQGSPGELRERPDFDRSMCRMLLNALIAQGAAIEVQYVHGHWRGVNDLEDFRRAADFAHAQSRFGDHETDRGAAGP